jgi:hypothetical protein
MAPKRTEFAILEWEFLRWNDSYRLLSDSEARVYLHLWATAVHLRRDTFSKHEIENGYVADLCGVTCANLSSTISSIVSITDETRTPILLKRGTHGSITVVGVYRKHRNLRGWIAGTIERRLKRKRTPRQGQGHGKNKSQIKSPILRVPDTHAKLPRPPGSIPP